MVKWLIGCTSTDVILLAVLARKYVVAACQSRLMCDVNHVCRYYCEVVSLNHLPVGRYCYMSDVLYSANDVVCLLVYLSVA